MRGKKSTPSLVPVVTFLFNVCPGSGCCRPAFFPATGDDVRSAELFLCRHRFYKDCNDGNPNQSYSGFINVVCSVALYALNKPNLFLDVIMDFYFWNGCFDLLYITYR